MHEELKQKLYVESPHDLASDEDNKYRDYIDKRVDGVRIIIEVQGGRVQEVHGLRDGETYSVIDWDDICDHQAHLEDDNE